MMREAAYLLSPEISLAALAILVLVLDLSLGRKSYVTRVAIIGLLVPLSFVLVLWGETIGWWGLIGDNREGLSPVVAPRVLLTLAFDQFALFFKFLIIGSLLLVFLMSDWYSDKFSDRRGEYFALMLIASIGMTLVASATEMITLYVALELATLPLVALVAFLGGVRSTEASLKYLILSAISSGVLLYGMVLLFGSLGTTNLEYMGAQIQSFGSSDGMRLGIPVLIVGCILMIAGFGFKIAAAPFHMWIPDVYEGAPTTVTAYLSVASKAAGFAVVLRVFLSVFENVQMDWVMLFSILAVVSMTIGNLLAIVQSNIKRMLAYSTIAHAGYMVVGLAAIASGSAQGAIVGSAALLLYLVAYAFTNLGAFFAVMLISEHVRGETLDKFTGIAKQAPWLAIGLTLFLVSLTGIPPLAGFMGKLFVFGAGVQSDLTWLVAVGVINSVVSAYYYLRLVRIMFREGETGSNLRWPNASCKIAVGVASGGTIFIGVWPQPVLAIATGIFETMF